MFLLKFLLPFFALAANINLIDDDEINPISVEEQIGILALFTPSPDWTILCRF